MKPPPMGYLLWLSPLFLWYIVQANSSDTDMFDFSKIDEPADDSDEKDDESPSKRCKSNRHVCSTLLKYPGDQKFSDGVHCACPGCSEVWREDDNMSLTWYHYEQKDRFVQYRFCIPVIPEKTCDKDRNELAVVMETETANWRIYMETARCKCDSNLYHLSNWWRRNKVWMYEFHCQKKNCPQKDALCSKIYIDNEHKKTLGYEFPCSCPIGYKCPSDREPDAIPSKDKIGYYIPMYCQALPQTKKKNA